MRNPDPNAVKQVVSSCIIRAVKGIPKSQRVSRTMALEHQTAQAEQGRAVVTAVINAIFKRF